MSKDIELSSRITQIVTDYFNDPTQSYTQLAKKFHISVPRVSQIMNHPKVLASYPILARRAVKSMVPQATGQLRKLMNQKVNLNVAEKVVSKILDSEKVLEPSIRTIKHEIQMKSVKELQDIITSSQNLPKQVIDAEIVSNDTEGQE